jgi:hypothetical protein
VIITEKVLLKKRMYTLINFGLYILREKNISWRLEAKKQPSNIDTSFTYVQNKVLLLTQVHGDLIYKYNYYLCPANGISGYGVDDYPLILPCSNWCAM